MSKAGDALLLSAVLQWLLPQSWGWAGAGAGQCRGQGWGWAVPGLGLGSAGLGLGWAVPGLGSAGAGIEDHEHCVNFAERKSKLQDKLDEAIRGLSVCLRIAIDTLSPLRSLCMEVGMFQAGSPLLCY